MPHPQGGVDHTRKEIWPRRVTIRTTAVVGIKRRRTVEFSSIRVRTQPSEVLCFMPCYLLRYQGGCPSLHNGSRGFRSKLNSLKRLKMGPLPRSNPVAFSRFSSARSESPGREAGHDLKDLDALMVKCRMYGGSLKVEVHYG
jgi:hypothetical protein